MRVHAAVQPGSPLARAFRERYLGPRALVFSTIVARGIAKGQLRADLDEALARDLVFGPPIYHLLVTGQPLGARAQSRLRGELESDRRRPGAAGVRRTA